MEDIESLAAYQSNSSYLRHYSEPPDTHEIVADAIKWARREPRTNFQFAVVLKTTDAVIGCAGIRLHGYSIGEAEIGIEINPNLWRQGFAREALSALIDFGISKLSVKTFWAYTARSNRAAQALVEEFGFAKFDETGDMVRMQFRPAE